MTYLFGKFSVGSDVDSDVTSKFSKSLPTDNFDIYKRGFSNGYILEGWHKNNNLFTSTYEDDDFYFITLGLISSSQSTHEPDIKTRVLTAYKNNEFSENLKGNYQIALFDKKKNKLTLHVSPFSEFQFFFAYLNGDFYFSNAVNILKKLIPQKSLDTEILKMELRLAYKKVTKFMINKKVKINQKKRENLDFYSTKTYESSIRRLRFGVILWFEKEVQFLCMPYEFKTRNQSINIKVHIKDLKIILIKLIDQVIRETKSEIASLLSGGLDSTMVSAVTAIELEDKKLFSLSSVPDNFEKIQSYKHYTLNEEPLILELCEKYKNISRFILKDSEKELSFCDIPKLAHLYGNGPDLMPMHSTWILQLIKNAKKSNCGTVLVSAMGNATISWGGQPLPKSPLKSFIKKTWYFLSCPVLSGKRKNFQASQLNWILRRLEETTSLYSSLSLLMNVNIVDITANPVLIDKCLSIHPKDYSHCNEYRGLMRELMKGIVPDSIRRESKRGPQNCDIFDQTKKGVNMFLENIHSYRNIPIIVECIDLDLTQKMLLNFFKKNDEKLCKKVDFSIAISSLLNLIEWTKINHEDETMSSDLTEHPLQQMVS